MPSPCPAATAPRSAAPPTGTRRATTSSSTLGADQVWKGTFSPQAGQYAFKAAINRSWDENYGAGGNRNGSDIFYNTDGGEVGFYYDHRTHWVTNTELDPILVATGDFQSEMGCPTDGDATCMRSWLQDPDRDGTYSFTTIDIPAGSYSVSVGASGPVPFTVEEGLATTIAVQTTGSGAQGADRDHRRDVRPGLRA